MIVYKITNKLNGKVYIGQTVAINPVDRWKRHRKNAKDKVNHPLYDSMNKHGIENFSFEIIESAIDLSSLNKKESEMIFAHNSTNRDFGYNLMSGGGNSFHHESSIKKMSQVHKGKVLNENHKKSISEGVKKVFSENPEKLDGAYKAFEVIREKWKKEGYHPKRGKKLSDKARKNIADAKIGSKNPMFGKKLNEKQMSAIKAGQEKRLKNLPSVLCHQNGKIYPSVIEAAADLGLKRPSVSGVLTGFRKSCYGHTFEYVKKDGSDE